MRNLRSKIRTARAGAGRMLAACVLPLLAVWVYAVNGEVELPSVPALDALIERFKPQAADAGDPGPHASAAEPARERADSSTSAHSGTHPE
jgi:hypothetical protein